MKNVGRIFLLVVAIAIGGFLGYALLPGFEMKKMIIFGIACVAMGVVFHQLDKAISKR